MISIGEEEGEVFNKSVAENLFKTNLWKAC